MTIRAKSRRRLLLLLTLTILVVGGAAIFYLQREAKLDKAARLAREEGVAAHAQGDHAEAVLKLGRFIKRLPPDALALQLYGESILELPDRSRRHMQSAIAALRRSVELAPENEEARRVLMEVYLRGGVRTEAIEQADWFLERDPMDEWALRTKVRTLQKMSQFKKARAVLDERAQRGPLHLEEQLLYLELMADLKAEPDHIRARATRIAATRRGDRRYPLLRAHALLLTDDIKGARAILQPLALSARRNAAFARLMLPDLDAAGLPAQAVDILRSVPTSDLDIVLRADMIRRLWEAGDAKTLTETVRQWGADGLQRLSTPVLGYATLAWRKLGRLPEAEATLVVLEGRTLQDSALGWSRLLRDASPREGATYASRISACLDAIERDGSNAQTHFTLALLYIGAREDQLAIRQLREANRLSPAWQEPAALAANLLARSGRLRDAAHVAQRADSLGSRDPGVALLRAVAKMAGPGASGRPFAELLLEGLDQKGLAAENTPAIRLALLASLGRKDRVRTLIEQILDPKASPDGDLLLACARLSAALELDTGQRCLDRYEELHGATPAFAILLAAQAAARKGPAQALAVFRQRRSLSGATRLDDWDIAEADLLLGQDRRDEAVAIWGGLVERGAAEPWQLLKILGAQEAWEDLEFAKQASEALRTATGDSGLWWRYYRAKVLLAAEDVDAAAVDEALALLKGILDLADEHVPARLLLAEAYADHGRGEEALNQLLITRGRVLSSVPLDLRIARLHRRIGQNTAAQDILNQLVQSGVAQAEHQVAIASLLARLGARDKALELLRQIPDDVGGVAERQRRAELLAASGQLERARRLVESVLAERVNERALLLAAALAEFRGESPSAEAYLARLGETKLGPIERDRAKAAHYRRVGKYDRAADILRHVVASENAQRTDWLALLGHELRQGRFDELQQLLKRARERGDVGQEGEEGALSIDVLRAATDRPALRSLGAAYVGQPDRRDVAERALRLLVGETAEGGPSHADRARLRSLAQANLDFLELQMAVVQALVLAAEDDDALELCRTALSKFPSDPEPARVLAECLAAQRRPERAREAAAEWRIRAAGVRGTREPDLFIARLSTPADATALLQPYVEQSLEQDYAPLLVTHAGALARSGRVAEARTLLEPHLKRRAAAAEAWAHTAGVVASRGDIDSARAMLRHEALLAAPTSRAVRIELATAWRFIGAATRDPGAVDKVREYLAAASGGGDVTPVEWERIGLLYESVGETKAAEEAYRHAVDGASDRLVALNNLAMLLAESGRGQESVSLAERLVALAPNETEFLDTLAKTQVRSRDLASALKQYEKCHLLDSENARWAIRILEVMLAQGDRREAKRRFGAFERRYSEDRMSPQLKAAWGAVRGRVNKVAGG